MNENELESMVNYIADRVDIPVLQVWRYYNQAFKKSAKKITSDYRELTDKSIDETYRENRSQNLKERILQNKILKNNQEEITDLNKVKYYYKTILDGKNWMYRLTSSIENYCFLCAKKI